MDQEHAQRHRPRHQPALGPDWRHRAARGVGGRIAGRDGLARPTPLRPRLRSGGASRLPGRRGRLRGRGEPQGLAQQPLRQHRQQRAQPGRLDHAGTRGVDHGDAAGADRLQQARHAQHRVAAQLQRVGEVVVHEAQQHVDRLQRGQRLEVHPPVAHGEVAALDQGCAELAGQEHVLQERRRELPRGEQGHARRSAVLARRRQTGEAGLPHLEERLQAAHRRGPEQLRHGAHQHAAVLQRGPDAARSLQPVGRHVPRAVGQAHQVGRVGVDSGAAGGSHVAARPEETRVGVDEARRHQALGQQAPLAVEVGGDGVEQARALVQATGERGPLLGRQQHRDRAQQRGGGLRAAAGIGDAGLCVLARHAGGAGGEHPVRQGVQRADQRRPRGAQATAAGHHLVELRRRRGPGRRTIRQRLSRVRVGRGKGEERGEAGVVTVHGRAVPSTRRQAPWTGRRGCARMPPPAHAAGHDCAARDAGKARIGP